MSNRRLRIAFLGTAEFAVPTLQRIAAGEDEIAAVFTKPDRPAGRGRKLRAAPVKLAAAELGLPLLHPERVSDTEGIEALQSISPDVVLVAAFGEVLSAEALSLPRIGAVNLHASLLPRYRGAAPIQRALMAGETQTGVTVQWMAPEVDAGDIILRRPVEIGPEEDFGALHDRLAVEGAHAAAEALDLIRADRAPRLPQQHGEATLAPAIGREDLSIDWELPATALANLVRALSPRPGARTSREGDLLKVLAARAAKYNGVAGGIPGVVMELTTAGFQVATGSGSLLVLRVQPAGRGVMGAADYVKGYHLRRGEQLGAQQTSRGALDAL